MSEATATGTEEVASSGYLSKSDLRRDFGFTDCLFERLGPPDRCQPAPELGSAELQRVYSRDRVEEWLANNQDLMDAREIKRKAQEARLARERQAAVVRRDEVCRQIAASIRDWEERELPALDSFLSKVRTTLNGESDKLDGESTERAIFDHILNHLSDYAGLARMLNRLEAGFELSAAVRVYVYTRIVRHYELRLDPLEVAFPAGARSMLPAAFAAGDPQQVAANIIGLAE